MFNFEDDERIKLCYLDIIERIEMLKQRFDGPLPSDSIKHTILTFIPLFFGELDQTEINDIYVCLRHMIDTKFSQTDVIPMFLEDKTKHKEWLNPEKINKNKWHHWRFYRDVKIKIDHATIDQIKNIHVTTNAILSRIEDPERPGPWDIRGMVVGDVQSGKTSNYIGLIAKAIDAGYKVIIVLAGITNDLRIQTQKRIDNGLLGYSSEKKFEHATVKVGPKGIVIQTLTNSSLKGDYTKGSFVPNIQIADGSCLLYVVKKNVSVLRNVYLDLKTKNNQGPKLSAPLLMIDDEADNASINGKLPAYDPVTNHKIDPEEVDPTAINKLIRAILTRFERKAYIGYTATPFANIFGVPNIGIDSKYEDEKLGITIDVGEDLFPRSFISYIEPPKNYFGPERVFGISDDKTDRMPIVVDITKEFPNDIIFTYKEQGITYTTNQPDRIILRRGKEKIISNKMVKLDAMPSSMRYAINGFFIASVVRRLRNSGKDIIHNTMLIHVDRLTATHEDLKIWVNEYIDDCKSIFETGEKSEQDAFFSQLEEVWKKEFKRKYSDILKLVDDESLTQIEWDSIKQHLPCLVKEIRCVLVNGTKAGESLDYDNAKKSLTVIVIGGDKLARGLTLAGLTTSYFLRHTKMYDSLAQMGRWFGYRDGYIDVCRIYATSTILSGFEEVALANYDLKEQFRILTNEKNLTPEDFGLRIRVRPNSIMQITSAYKQKNMHTQRLSYSNYADSTRYLPLNEETNNHNFEFCKKFISDLGTWTDRKSFTGEGFYRWMNINPELIINFLSEFTIISNRGTLSTELLKEYIKKANKNGELTYWTVVLVSGEMNKTDYGSQITINQSKRTVSVLEDCYEINHRRLPSGADEAFDLSKEQYEEALRITNSIREKRGESPAKIPSPSAIRQVRLATNGLLLIYTLSLVEDDERKIIHENIPGFMISFPESHNRSLNCIVYRANNVSERIRILNEQRGSIGEENG